MKRRKLTQERADRINRRRDLCEGPRSWECDAERLVIIDGRALSLPAPAPGTPTFRGRE